MKGRRTQGKAKTADRVKSREIRVRKELDLISSNTYIVKRRLVNAAVLATNASGFIATQQITSDGARSCADWTNLSTRYLTFRVKAIRIRAWPIVDMTTAVTVGGGAVTPHPTAIAFATYKEGNSYLSYVSLCTGADGRIFNGRERCIEYTADWAGNPDAKLWSPTNAAIPTAQQFAIQFQDQGAAPASAASTTYYRILYEFEVEFNVPA